jgi:hypothetical protein
MSSIISIISLSSLTRYLPSPSSFNDLAHIFSSILVNYCSISSQSTIRIVLNITKYHMPIAIEAAFLLGSIGTDELSTSYKGPIIKLTFIDVPIRICIDSISLHPIVVPSTLVLVTKGKLYRSSSRFPVIV